MNRFSCVMVSCQIIGRIVSLFIMNMKELHRRSCLFFSEENGSYPLHLVVIPIFLKKSKHAIIYPHRHEII